MLVADAQFRRIIGYSDLAHLVIAIDRRHLTRQGRNGSAQEVREVVSV